ncbi:MAG: DNA polymerase III subunit beta, partial [Clostridia bacterium]|nr:DNA polymerase III subunit beta [Clostridia bacterium]
MKFICTKDILLNSIGIVSKAVNSTSTLDILKGIKIEVTDNVKLTGSDLDLSIESIFEADIREKGNIIVDARIFGDIIRKLPDGDVELYTTNDNEVKIQCKNTNFNILYLSAQGYPDIKRVENGEKIKIYSQDLKNIIKNTIFSISTNDSRPVLTGSKFEITNSNMKVVSIDRSRLALRNQIIP